MLFHLEVRNAVTQQTADPVVLLEQGNAVSRARELLGAGHARRAGAYHRDRLACAPGGHLRRDPPFAPAAIDDFAFDRLDRHRLVDDVQRAGGLARGRADAAGELREVVGRMQHFQRILPIAFVD